MAREVVISINLFPRTNTCRNPAADTLVECSDVSLLSIATLDFVMFTGLMKMPCYCILASVAPSSLFQMFHTSCSSLANVLLSGKDSNFDLKRSRLTFLIWNGNASLL